MLRHVEGRVARLYVLCAVKSEWEVAGRLKAIVPPRGRALEEARIEAQEGVLPE